MAKSLVTRHHNGTLIARRDRERLQTRGWVATRDYVRDFITVVYEIDEDTHEAECVGFITKPEHLRHVRARMDTDFVRRNTLVRVKDLMDVKQMSFRTGRSKSTIVGTWLKWPDFPQHVGEWGGSKVWYWPDVVACLERHGVTVRREVANGGSNGQDEGADTEGSRPAGRGDSQESREG